MKTSEAEFVRRVRSQNELNPHESSYGRVGCFVHQEVYTTNKLGR